MADRTFKTSGGHNVVLKELLTGRDIEYIEQPMLALQIAFGEKGKLEGGLNAGDAKRDSTHRAIEKVVVSVDDVVTGDLLGKVLDLPAKDFKEVVAEVDKVVSGEGF